MKEKNYSYVAFLKKTIPLFLMMLFVNVCWGQTYFDMSSGNYSQNFNGITTLPTNFSTVAVLNTGTIPVATKTTTASASSLAVVASGAAVGIDVATSTRLVFLTTGGTPGNTTAIATDLNLNFTNRIAGVLSFDASTIFNTTGDRVGTLRVYYSHDNTAWTELTGSNLPYIATNNVSGSGLVSITLPAELNNKSTVKFRFYYHNGTANGTTGSRPRIGVDNLVVTSTASGCSAPTTASSAYSFTNIAQTAMDVAFAVGNGAGRVVMMNTSNTFTAPVSGANPTANTVYGGGQQVVYNGTGNSFSVSGLDPSTAYYYSIYEYCSPDRTYGSGFAGNQTTIASANPLLSLSGTLAHGSSCLNVAATSVEYTITNTGLSTATGISVSSSNPEFVVSGLSSTSIAASGTATYLVTFTPATVGAKTATITVNSTNAATETDALTGSGINSSVSVTTAGSSDVFATMANVNGSLIQGCSPVTAYGFEYSTTNNFDNGTGTSVTSSNLNGGNFTLTLSSLQSNTTYYFKAFATDDNGTVRGTQSSFTTTAIEFPTANAATALTQTGFMANWDAVAGATGYELDVYKSVGSITQVINETFTWTANSTGGNDDLWSGSVASGTIVAGDLVGWTLTSANKANYCIKAGSSSNLGSVTTPELNFSGSGVLTFRAGAWNGGSEQTTLKLEISGGGTLNISQVTMVKGAFTNFTVNISDATALTKISFKGFANSNSRFFLDDVKIMGGTMVITPADGYPDLAVVGTSKVVTGLTSNTQYFYKVRAKDANSTSVNSNEISVTTLNGSTTYAAGAWTNGVPTADVDAIINDNFTTSGNLTAKSLTINSGNVFTVATGNTLTVVNTITNNAGVSGLVIKNNGVFLQTSTAANTALATVERNSSPLFLMDYTLWSSPVTGQNLRAFSPATLFNRFYSYDTATNVYAQEIFTTEQMNTINFGTGNGYLIRMPNNWVANTGGASALAFEGSFKGTLNNGNVSKSLLLTGSKFNLVGNPYASPINIATFMSVNTTQIEGSLYMFRKKGSAALPAGSGYVAYNSLGQNQAIFGAQNGSTIPSTLTHIQTGQGFFVTAKAGATAVTFNNTMREAASTEFFKTIAPVEMDRLWLTLSDATAPVGHMLVGYTNEATQGVDSNFDAPYFNDSPLALTSIINNNEYSIQGRALPFTATDAVPLGFKTDVAGSYSIALSNSDGIFAGSQDVFLKDNATNQLHNLKTAAYTFNSAVGVFNERFELRYQGTLDTNNPSLGSSSILIAVKDQQIKINAGSVMMEKVELIDVAGRVIYTLEDVNATTATIENLVSSNQMLIVRISTKGNGVVSQKIIF